MIPVRLSVWTTGQLAPSGSSLTTTTRLPARRRARRYQGSTALRTTMKPVTRSQAARRPKWGTLFSEPAGQPT